MKKQFKKIIFVTIGTIILFGLAFGENFSSITDWSTPELAGYNTFAVLATLGAVFLIYKGVKK